MRHDWPPIEGLVAFTKKHGAREAARRLDVSVTTLRSHFYKHGLTAEDYTEKQALAPDALREIRELIDG